ncbi:MAG: hypothetical protein AB8G23_21900 [Myxococcota bacterium]
MLTQKRSGALKRPGLLTTLALCAALWIPVWPLAQPAHAGGGGDESNEENASLVFMSLSLPECHGEQIDMKSSLASLHQRIASKEGDQEAYFAHFRDLRCLSARDFKQTYAAMMEGTPEAGESVDYAPLVFLYMDMGARLIDDEARGWLADAARQAESQDAIRETSFYAVSYRDLLAIPSEFTTGLMGSFEGSTWSGRCSFSEMMWTDEGIPYCPGDDICPALRHTTTGNALEGMEAEELVSLCEDLCRAAPQNGDPNAPNAKELGSLCSVENNGRPILPERERVGVLACLSDYSESLQDAEDLSACLVTRKTSTIDLLTRRPDLHVAVSDQCKLSSNAPPPVRETRRERLEAEKKELEEERKRLEKLHDEFMDRYYPLAYREGSDEQWEKEQHERIWSERNKEMKKEIARLQREIDAEAAAEERKAKRDQHLAPPLYRCAQDDASCSDSCSIIDQQRRSFYQCVQHEVDEPISTEPDTPSRGDRTDPRVTDPPKDGPVDDPDFVQLTTCLDAVLGGGETNRCESQLQCADGEFPVVNEFDQCACPGEAFDPFELSCETLVECLPDEPCECSGAPGEQAPIPGVNPDTMLIIQSEDR